MSEQPELSAEEWALVIELLERELNDLPAEIHHTRLAAYRDELRRRESLVKSLLDRIKATRTT
jgi:hypothetical protein